LGLLHADVVCERLEREFGLSLVLTPPQVEFKKDNHSYLEPYVKLTIITPSKYLGDVLALCQNHRAKFLTMNNIGKSDSIQLNYEMPMVELITDFFDKLKSASSGYASLDWEFLDYRPVLASPLTLLLNGREIDEFSEIVPSQKAYEKASFLVSRLKELIPRQQFEVRIQAAFLGKIIASARIAPFRKDVLVKSGKVLGTGDVGRKRKLLEKQKEGKKRMKMVGDVEIPKEAFLKLFRR
jgi:GTP-binding protein LepA